MRPRVDRGEDAGEVGAGQNRVAVRVEGEGGDVPAERVDAAVCHQAGESGVGLPGGSAVGAELHRPAAAVVNGVELQGIGRVDVERPGVAQAAVQRGQGGRAVESSRQAVERRCAADTEVEIEGRRARGARCFDGEAARRSTRQGGGPICVHAVPALVVTQTV